MFFSHLQTMETPFVFQGCDDDLLFQGSGGSPPAGEGRRESPGLLLRGHHPPQRQARLGDLPRRQGGGGVWGDEVNLEIMAELVTKTQQ